MDSIAVPRHTRSRNVKSGSKRAMSIDDLRDRCFIMSNKVISTGINRHRLQKVFSKIGSKRMSVQMPTVSG